MRRSALSAGILSGEGGVPISSQQEDSELENGVSGSMQHEDSLQNIIYGENMGLIETAGSQTPPFVIGSYGGNSFGAHSYGAHGHGHLMHMIHHNHSDLTPRAQDEGHDDTFDVGAALEERLLSLQQQDSVLPWEAVALGDHFPKTPASTAAVFGMINAIAGIPALIAFASIVFKDPVYHPYLDACCKLFFLSSSLHQTIFNVASTLPFAMGQVQDVGIIFMSAMASSIAADVSHVASALSSSLVCMTVSTVFVGLCVLVVAKKSWAGFIQYIPLPVMGGYLGYVGYFCIASGTGLGSSQEIGSLTSWVRVFNRDSLIKLIPTVSACLSMIATMKYSRHPMALPALLLALIALFHVFLFVFGIPLSAAQDAGWAMQSSDGPVMIWDLFKLYGAEIDIPSIMKQAAKAVGLTLVVIFGSAMDIAAVAQDVPVRLDFNRELATVAYSNIVTGLVGVGFTGSYIFSQTIFTMRGGVYNRINGWVIAGAELFCVLYPYSIIQYIPNYFLGGLVIWFGFEICRDWMILSYYKLTKVEYVLLWITFFSVMQFGLEGGIAAGIVSATIYFSYAYAQSQVENLKPVIGCKSNVIRQTEQQEVLSDLRDEHLVTVQLQGFIFFGSASSIGTKMNALVEQLNTNTTFKFFVMDFSKVSGMDSSGSRTIAGVTREMHRHGITPIITGLVNRGVERLLISTGLQLKSMSWPPTLDGNVSVDDAYMVECGVVGSPTDVPYLYSFQTLDVGIRFCEDCLLNKFANCPTASGATPLRDILETHLRKLPVLKSSSADSLAKQIAPYVSYKNFSRGDIIWTRGKAAEEFIFVEQGVVSVTEYGLKNTENTPIRSFELGPGSVCGSTDFFLARDHSTNAMCASTTCRIFSVSRSAIQQMAQQVPLALVALQVVIMRLNSNDLFAAADTNVT